MRPRTVAPFHVERVDPPDGAIGVLRDDPVLVRLSAPIDSDRLGEATVEVREAGGAVPSRVETLDGGRVLVWWPGRRLRPGREHRLVARGLRDRQGREAPALASRFTPGPLSGREIRSPDETTPVVAGGARSGSRSDGDNRGPVTLRSPGQ